MEHSGFNQLQTRVMIIQSSILYFSFHFIATINSIRTKKTRKYLDRECSSIEDLLQGNIGEEVQLLITNSIARSKEWISGRIKSVQRPQDRSSDDEDEDISGKLSSNFSL